MESLPAPSRTHKYVFWFLLATLSMALAEVGTMNDPIPWLHPGGWLVGYPVYGLHILVLAGLMYRWPMAGLSTLMAYGGLFGLYEGYMTKQLWNPNWAMEATASIGGVRVLHTLLLVFWAHPLLAFVMPLLLCELLAVAPGRLSRRVPLVAGSRSRTRLFLLLLGLYLGTMVGAKLAGREAMAIPIIAVTVVTALGLLWRVVLRGQRWRLEELLPRDRELIVLGVLLAVAYLLFGTQIRPEAFPGAWLPHVLVWCLYGFLVMVIVVTSRRTKPLSLEARPAPGNAHAITLACLGAGVFLGTAWLQAPFKYPGEAVALLTFIGGSVCNVLFLAWCGLTGVIAWQRNPPEREHPSSPVLPGTGGTAVRAATNPHPRESGEPRERSGCGANHGSPRSRE